MVVLQRNETSDIVENIVEIYGSDAAFIRRIYLSNDIYYPIKAILKPNGHFIIAHRTIQAKTCLHIGISLVTINGQIIDQVYVIGAYLETAAGKKICWSLHSDAAQVNDLDLKYHSECIITPYYIPFPNVGRTYYSNVGREITQIDTWKTRCNCVGRATRIWNIFVYKQSCYS